LLCACTQPPPDQGPVTLPVRQIEDSGRDYALVFDGVQQYATTATGGFPGARDAQTLSLWFRVDTIVGRHAFLTLRKDFDSGVEFGISDGVVTAWRVHPDKVLVAAKTAVTPGVWHHAAYVFLVQSIGASSTMGQDFVYVDGTATDGIDNGVVDRRTPTTCWLGTLDGTHHLFQGRLDDLSVYGLTLPSVALGGAPSEDHLVLDLPFNEYPGNLTLFDHSPVANDGTLGDGIEQRAPTRLPRDQ
jgi:hypothetical protein